MQVYCDIPRYTNDMCNTLCQYDTIFDIRWCISCSGHTTTEAGTSAKYVCTCPPSMGKCLYFVFSRFELNIYPINCTNCISIEDETQRRLLSLSTNLSSYFSYQVHRLLRRKSAIRLCVFTAHKCHGNTRYTHTQTSIHTHTGYHDYYDEKMEEQEDGKEAAMKLMPRRQWMKSKSTFWNFWWEFSDCVYIFFFCCIVFSFGVLSFLSFSLMHWTWTLANEMP